MPNKNLEIEDDGLTDEERAALNDEDDGVSALADSGADDENEKPGAQDADDADVEKAAEAKAAADADDAKQAADAAKADANDAGITAAETGTQSAPILIAPAPEDAEAKLTEIANQKEALLNQFDDGDITAREYQKKLDELSKQERNIELDLREAQLAAKLETQRAQNDWIATCNAFVESNPVYKDNQRLYRALDQEVRDLANKPETANWSGQKFLEEAHKELAKAFNLPAATSNVKTPKRPTDNLPPNLAKVPAADTQDMDGGQYAVLDRLANSDPLAYEEALAKMPQAQRDAYMAAG